MTRTILINYLKNIKEELHTKYGITTLGLYGSYARDEATENSDVDIFYERDKNFQLASGLEFMNLDEKLAQDLQVKKVDFVALDFMNPIIKHYAKKDFIYV
ncbi:nucleotidyltransferase domain-containing protein [bacterium]|nr:nucleotidyltransferase domain-containing protein [bacterium]MBU1883339.1 nucleotidyltransferase domain-containing protein [bacterium]